MNCETAALTRLAFHFQICLVARHGMLDDRQAEASAAGLARTAAIDAVEALGEAREMLGCDADAGVLHRERRAVGDLEPYQPYFAVLGRIADGVRDQVTEGAGELAFRAEQVDRGRAVLLDAMAAARERQRVGAHALEERPGGDAIGGGREGAVHG